MGDYRELLAYKKAFDLATQIFCYSKTFPADEQYGLTNQIRRSSRSVCANIAEAYRRREQLRYFVSKLYDSQGENAETQVWLDFADSCQYFLNGILERLTNLNDEVGKLIWFMIRNPNKFL